MPGLIPYFNHISRIQLLNHQPKLHKVMQSNAIARPGHSLRRQPGGHVCKIRDLLITSAHGRSGYTTERHSLVTKTFRVMRITTFLLLAFAVHVSAKVSSQQITYSGENVSLEKVFAVIKKQTGFSVFYNPKLVREYNKVTVQADKMPLQNFLDEVLKNTTLHYSIEEETIFVSKRREGATEGLNPRLITPAFSAPPITGVVRDSTGTPLSGATVMNKRTKKSVQTDGKGEFSIDGQHEDVLTVSFVGFENYNFKATTAHALIILKNSDSPLDEIQIRAYGTTSRRLNTGSITTVSAEEISRQNINNPLLALQAKVPNLVITPSSGLPGASISLQLRGQNSVAGAKTEPLIVIDGVPFQNTLSTASLGTFGNIGEQMSALGYVNSTDIESINVLADADATSIYGSRGGNGVVLITTKKGRSGPTQVNINIMTGFSELPRERRVKLLNTAEYLEMRAEAIENDGAVAQVTDKFGSGYAPDLLLWDQSRYTDWQKELLGGKPTWTNANLSISGGNPAIQYLISGTYNKQGYVFPTNIRGANQAKFETGTIHFSLTGNSSNNKLNTSLGGSYSINNRTGSQFDFTRLAMSLAPNAPALYTPNGNLNWELNPNFVENAATWINPLAQLLQSAESRTDNLTSNASISYKITPELVLKATAGYAYLQVNQLNLTPIASKDPTSFTVFNGRSFVPGEASYVNAASRSWTIDPHISYSKDLFEGQLSVLMGATMQGQSYNSQTLGANNYTDDAFIRNFAAAGSFRNRNRSSEYKYVGAFGRVNYNLKDKYLLNVNFRRDGSSRFGPRNQFGNFWSAGTAWLFSNEEILKHVMPALSYGKIRASYGTSGNDGIGDYQYLDLYSNTSPSGTYQGIRTLATNASNPYFGWEEIRKGELGLETGFLKDRLLFTIAYWRTRCGNQLGRVTLPATGGGSVIIINNPVKIQNAGWDFTLNIKNVITRNFSWTTSANLGIQYNKVLKIPEGFSVAYSNIPALSQNIDDLIGKPFSGFLYNYEFRGVDPSTGLYQFSKRDGGLATNPFEAEFKNYVNIMPTTLGVSNAFTFKGFVLTTVLQLVKQKAVNYLFSSGDLLAPGFFWPDGDRGNQPAAVLNRWRKPGDNTYIQKFTQTFDVPFFAWLNAVGINSPFYEDASFIRLRNAQLLYNLPDKWKRKLHSKNANVFIQGQNLFTITRYKHADPETKLITVLPTLRTYTAGISFGF